MTITLRPRVASAERLIAGAGPGGAHELVCTRCVFTVAEECGGSGPLDGAGFGGLRNAFELAVTDVTRVVIIAGVGVCHPVGAPFERRALLNGLRAGGSPE